MQRKEDKALLPLMIGALVGTTVVFFLIGLIFDMQWFLLPLGLLLGVLLAFILFGRRVQKNVYRKAEGQAGAAAWVLENLQGKLAGRQRRRRDHPARRRAPRHRPARGDLRRRGFAAAGQIAHSGRRRSRTARLVGDTPIYESDRRQRGRPDSPFKELQKYLTKLPSQHRRQADRLRSRGRLSALSSRSGPAMPKGPMPPGAKMKGMQRAIRRR